MNFTFKFYIALATITISLNLHAQNKVGINTTDIDDSVILDVTSTDKGLLIPRINLISVFNTTTPINTPEIGLIIWNTNASVLNGNGVGYYYYNGLQWTKFQNPSTLDKAYDSGGPGNGRLIFADASAVKITATDGLYITGTFGSGVNIDSEESGAGTRLFFNPRNAAFKAGSTLGPTFSANESRNYSFGFGFDIETRSGRGFAANNETATNTQGTNASAFGYLSEARQNSSFVTGTSNFSTQNNSISFGSNNNTKGRSGWASGDNNIAESVGEIVFGTYAKQYPRFNQNEDDADPSNDDMDSHNENHSADRVFVIGNGNSIVSNNAIEIWKTGVIEINEAYEIPIADGASNNIILTNGSGIANWQTQNNIVDPYTHLQMFTSSTPYIMNNTGANTDLPNFDLGVIPTVFSALGSLEVRMIVYYTNKVGSIPTLRVRADNGILSTNILSSATSCGSIQATPSASQISLSSKG